MTNEPQRIESDAASQLDGDLAEIRLLLREAAKHGKSDDLGFEYRIDFMAAASRLFAGAVNATTLIARLRGQAPETRHRVFVDQPDRPAWPPAPTGPLTEEERAARDRRMRETAARYYAEWEEMERNGDPAPMKRPLGHTPDEKSKTTSSPSPTGPRIRF